MNFLSRIDDDDDDNDGKKKKMPTKRQTLMHVLYIEWIREKNSQRTNEQSVSSSSGTKFPFNFRLQSAHKDTMYGRSWFSLHLDVCVCVCKLMGFIRIPHHLMEIVISCSWFLFFVAVGSFAVLVTICVCGKDDGIPWMRACVHLKQRERMLTVDFPNNS